MPKIEIVIPCFNEAKRLRGDQFLPLLDDPEIHLLFVDDGSRDATLTVLREITNGAPRTRFISLGGNFGKGEAVRFGLLDALAHGASIVGYLDADGSTPPTEIPRMLAHLNERNASVALGSRVAMLGSDIRRKPWRHYLGRVFATAASLVLDLVVYDTQCGAKLFRNTPALRSAIRSQFVSRWAFDVELIGRLMTGDGEVAPLSIDQIIEVPLRQWTHVSGSKLRPRTMVTTGLELLSVRHALNQRRSLRRKAERS